MRLEADVGTQKLHYAGLIMRRLRLLALARKPLVLDVGIVAALAISSGVVGWRLFLDPSFLKSPKSVFLYGVSWWQGPVWWWLAAVTGLAALVMRRRFPVTVFAVAAAATLFHLHSGWPFLPADAAALVALYSAAAYARRLASVAVLLVALASLDVRSATPFKFFGWTGGIALFVLLVLGAWFAGAYVGQLNQRARTLERERDEQASLAARAERQRITRELHDVVAHGLSVIVVQAQGASAALRSRPEEASQALDAIVSTGRQSLAEMRRLLGISRPEEGEGATLAPQPGTALLPELIEDVRGAGFPVELTVEGPPRDLPPTVDLSAFRIVQEGLTNTMKHAGPGATTRVRVRYLPGGVELAIDDTGQGPPGDADGRGSGLRGMRERAGLLGGRLDAGPRAGGGFEVHAWLPAETEPP